MLHSFMITSGRNGILLYRKIFTKALNQSRLIAGLVTALCNFSLSSGVGLPVSTIQLDHVSVAIVETPADDNDPNQQHLRAVLFHDPADVRITLLSISTEAHFTVVFIKQLRPNIDSKGLSSHRCLSSH